MRRTVLAAVLLASCTAQPPADAGAMDATPPDGSRDASNDASMDARPPPPTFVTPADTGPIDAMGGCVGETFCPTPVPPEPNDVTPPSVPCVPDGSIGMDAGGDPCVHHVQCVDRWAVTYIDGTCVDGSCVFDLPPTFEYCFGGCGPGWSWNGESRCLNPGPTAP
jgi:hypothetical protein